MLELAAVAWDNKPPVQYWIYGIVTHVLGYSEAAIHLVPLVSVIAAVLAVTDSVEPGTALIDEAPALRSWWNGFRETPAMVKTRSDESHY